MHWPSEHTLEAAALAKGRSSAYPVKVGGMAPIFHRYPCYHSVISSSANENKILLCHHVPISSPRSFSFSAVTSRRVISLSTQHWTQLYKNSLIQVCKVSTARLLQMVYLGASVKMGSFKN